MVRKVVILGLMLLLVSCGSDYSEVELVSISAEFNTWHWAELWVEVYNNGNSLGEITRWRVDISNKGDNIVWFESSLLYGTPNGKDWSPVVGPNQANKFCVHREHSAGEYRGAVAKVAVWVSDAEGEYMIGGESRFPSDW